MTSILEKFIKVEEDINKYTAGYPKRRKKQDLERIVERMEVLFKDIELKEDKDKYNKLYDKLWDWYNNPEFLNVYPNRNKRPKYPNKVEAFPFTKEELSEKNKNPIYATTIKQLRKFEKTLPEGSIKRRVLNAILRGGDPDLFEGEQRQAIDKAYDELGDDIERLGKEGGIEMEIVKEESKEEAKQEEEDIEPRMEKEEMEKKEERKTEQQEEEEEKTKKKEEDVKEEAKLEEEAEVKMEETAEELSMEEIHNNIRKDERESVMREFNLVDPTIGTIDIPKERLGIEGKTIKILNDDIKYFINRFPDMLKMEASVYKKTNKKNKKALQDLHRRIQAKLSPDPKKEEGGKVGIILDADKFIDMKITELLATKTLEGLTPANLVDITEKPKSQGRDVGSYTITKNRAGRDVINNAPVYRAIPSTQPEQPKRRGEIKQETIYKNTAMDKVDIARMEMRENPFIRKQKSKPLNIIL